MTRKQLNRAKEIDWELRHLNDVLYLEQTNDNYSGKYRIDFDNCGTSLIIMLKNLEDKIVPILYNRMKELEKELEQL